MKSIVIIVASLFPLISAFSLSPEIGSRREICKAIVSGGACVIAGFALPSLAEEDYITTDRGIKYKVVTPPTNPDSAPPVRGQTVKALYTLYLNGFPEDTAQAKKVDGSRGPFGEKPFEFPVGVSQVIAGWDLAILDMRVGESRKLVIPSDLGYGQFGAGRIPERATLYFKVELAEIGFLPKLTEDQEKWLVDNPL
ncbi:hypothetical protein ACHAXR_002123 [Thalassiosira sp. AJA248-18]